MCRYGMNTYKPHYACFDCRKSFKRRLPRDVGHTGPSKAAICPQCARPMADMGLDFQLPKKSDLKAWKASQMLWEVGETFHGCGCSGPGFQPRDPAAFRTFLLMKLEE